MVPQVIASQVEAVGRAFLSLRPLVALGLGGWTLAWLWLGAPVSADQLHAVTFTLALGLTLFTVEALWVRRRAITSRWLFLSLASTVVLLAGASRALGGLSSPFLPMVLAPCGVGFAAFGRSSRSWALLGVLGVVMLGLAVAPAWPPLPVLTHQGIAFGAVLACASLLWLGAGSLAAAYVRAAEQVVRSSDVLVAQAHARVRSVEELTGHFGHELKNPLAALRAVVELLREDSSEARTVRRLEVAATEVARLERVLEQGLDFSRPPSRAVRAPGKVEEVVREVLLVLEPQAVRRGVGLPLSPSGGEGEMVTSFDAARLREAVMNLVLNALEVTPSGGVVRVELSRAGDDLVLSVLDGGPPLDDAALARLGTPFFTTRVGGTGLGVAMARQVAAQHGGTLVYSRVSNGTRADLTFPVREASSASEVA